jgi:hypothetical protein
MPFFSFRTLFKMVQGWKKMPADSAGVAGQSGKWREFGLVCGWFGRHT